MLWLHSAGKMPPSLGLHRTWQRPGWPAAGPALLGPGPGRSEPPPVCFSHPLRREAVSPLPLMLQLTLLGLCLLQGRRQVWPLRQPPHFPGELWGWGPEEALQKHLPIPFLSSTPALDSEVRVLRLLGAVGSRGHSLLPPEALLSWWPGAGEQSVCLLAVFLFLLKGLIS